MANKPEATATAFPFAALGGCAAIAGAIVAGAAVFDNPAPAIGTTLFNGVFLWAVLAFFFLVLRRLVTMPIQIFIAMIMGIAVGGLSRTFGFDVFVTDYLGIFGELFLLLLKMIIVPMVFVSILMGVAGLGDVRRLGPLGVKTLLYFLSVTSVAVVIGLVLVNVIRPGEYIDADKRTSLLESAAAGKSADEELSTGMIIQKETLPSFIQSPVRTDEYGVGVMAIIVFAMLLGAGLTAHPDKSATALNTFRAIDDAMVTLIMWIMVLAPVGVFALMSKAIGALGVDYLASLAVYVVTVLLGLFNHFWVLIGIAWVFGGIPPMRYLKGMAPALQLAFTTSSSNATLPLNIHCATERVGINKGVVKFILPIGATANMDGTALYTTVAALFVAQAYGIELGLQQQIIVFLTAVIVSIGTVGIPGASLTLMNIIFSAAGIPLEGIALIVGVDRILDMCRTVVNVMGDSIAAAVIARTEAFHEEEV